MENYTSRKEYLKKLFGYKDQDLIKVITGLRRSGKSTLLEMYRAELLKLGIASSQIVSLNFEEMELRVNIHKKGPQLFIKSIPAKLKKITYHF